MAEKSCESTATLVEGAIETEMVQTNSNLSPDGNVYTYVIPFRSCAFFLWDIERVKRFCLEPKPQLVALLKEIASDLKKGAAPGDGNVRFGIFEDVIMVGLTLTNQTVAGEQALRGRARTVLTTTIGKLKTGLPKINMGLCEDILADPVKRACLQGIVVQKNLIWNAKR
jgi:hypothetical protein